MSQSEHELPLPDFDELPFGSLRHRIRALTENDLRLLLDHERSHANRVPVVELLTSRLGELERGATPSGGEQSERPEVAQHKRAGSPVSPSGPPESGRPTPHGTGGPTGKGMEHD